MNMRPMRITSIGILAFALGAATSAGLSVASATTEPVDPASSAAPGDMAPGCAEITALLDAADGIGAAFFAEDGVAIGDILATLPALGEAALAAAPPEIADTVADFVAPLPELAAARRRDRLHRPGRRSRSIELASADTGVR